MRMPFLPFLVVAALFIAACENVDDSSSGIQQAVGWQKPIVDQQQQAAGQPEQPVGQQQSSDDDSQDMISFTGSVVFNVVGVNMDDTDDVVGFFAIHADDGEHYEPRNLPEEFKVNGLRVAVTARILRDWASIYQYGYLIDIIDISTSSDGVGEQEENGNEVTAADIAGAWAFVFEDTPVFSLMEDLTTIVVVGRRQLEETIPLIAVSDNEVQTGGYGIPWVTGTVQGRTISLSYDDMTDHFPGNLTMSLSGVVDGDRMSGTWMDNRPDRPATDGAWTATRISN